MIKTRENFRSLSTNIFTQHPDDNSSECSKSPSATRELEYTWALRSSSSSTSPCLKHRRTSEGEDNEEDDDRPIKKPKIFLDYDPAKLSKPCFACHFHIYDPLRYSTSSFNTKYRECAGPGWNDLKRLKEHLRKKHSVMQYCLDCEINPPSQNQLEMHCDTEGRHSTEELSVDGITESQWESIQRCTRGRGNEKRHAVDKWFDIWRILFPGVRLPKSPWYHSKLNTRPANHKEERAEESWQLAQSVNTEPNWTVSTAAEDFASYHDDEQFDIQTSNSLSIAQTPSLVSNTALTVSTLSSSDWRYENTALEPPWPIIPPAQGEQATPIMLEPSSEEQAWDSWFFGSIFTTDDCPYDLNIPTYITDDSFVENLMFENYQLMRSQHDIICSSTEVELADTPFRSPLFDDNTSKLVEDMEVNENAATTTNRFSEGQILQAIDSGYSSNHHTPCWETEEDDPHPKDHRSLDVDLTTESGPLSDSNVDRWMQEPVDPFEVKKLALFEILASEPELITSAIAIFESQWKLESLACSPGSVSCTTEGTPSQTYAPSSYQSSTSKRKTQMKWSRSSQPNGVPGQDDEEEEEEEEEPQRKRPKLSTDPEDGPTRKKYCCLFHKRHPTIYCLSKDPNMGTREQKKWSLCGGQGFPYLRHLIDHLKSHQIFDCNYCFEQFDDPGEYIRHRDVESGGTCTTTERLQGPRRDGIDLQQWTQITEIHKKRTAKRYNDSDKWMDMWNVIFPGVPAPPSPWSSEIDEVDEGVQLPASKPEIEAMISRWRTLFQAKIRTGFKFHKETFELLELLMRQAIEMGSVEKRMRNQLVTSFPTPVSSTNVPSTPLSTQESSVDGGLATQPRNISTSTGRRRMLPPVLAASTSSNRSNSPMAPYYASMPIPETIQDPSHRVYQSAETNQTPSTASPFPPPQYSDYPPERQRQRVQRLLSPLHNPQSYSRLDQVQAVGGNRSPVAQPISTRQEASHPHKKFLASPQNSHARSSYVQTQDNLSTDLPNQRVPQQPIVVHQSALGTQEEVAQLKQMVLKMWSAMSCGSPHIPGAPSLANTVGAFEGQSNQSVLPPRQQAGETYQNMTQGRQMIAPINSSQGIHQFNSKRPATNQNDSPPQAQTSAVGQDPSQDYIDPNLIDHPMLSGLSYWPDLDYMSGDPPPETPEQQYQIQSPQQQTPDNNPLDSVFEFENLVQNPGNQGTNSGYMPSGSEGNRGYL